MEQIATFALNFSIVFLCFADLIEHYTVQFFARHFARLVRTMRLWDIELVSKMKRNPANIRYDINKGDDMTNECCEQRTAFLFSLFTFRLLLSIAILFRATSSCAPHFIDVDVISHQSDVQFDTYFSFSFFCLYSFSSSFNNTQYQHDKLVFLQNILSSWCSVRSLSVSCHRQHHFYPFIVLFNMTYSRSRLQSFIHLVLSIHSTSYNSIAVSEWNERTQMERERDREKRERESVNLILSST